MQDGRGGEADEIHRGGVKSGKRSWQQRSARPLLYLPTLQYLHPTLIASFPYRIKSIPFHPLPSIVANIVLDRWRRQSYAVTAV